MTKHCALKLNGKPFSLSRPTPTVQKLKSFLDSAPADEVFTSDELAKRSAVSLNSIQNGSVRDCYDEYSYLAGRYRYWGNPKAVQELRKQVSQ